MSEFECYQGHIGSSKDFPAGRCRVCNSRVKYMDGKTNRQLRAENNEPEEREEEVEEKEEK